MARSTKAGVTVEATAYDRALATARSSCALLMLERPWMPSRFASA